MASSRTSAPLFTRPDSAPDYVPGKVVVRFQRNAVGPETATRLQRLTADDADLLPESIAGPLDYLNENAGLETVEPIFSPRRSTLARRRRLGPRRRHRLGAAASIVDVEDNSRAGVAVFTLDEEAISESLLKRIRSSRGVEVVERLPARWLAARPDPKQNMQWGLTAIRYFQANRPKATSIKVAIVDTGIDTSHPDLPEPVFYRHQGFRSDDLVGHGTHVSGIVAATANNAVGITGIADCKLGVWKVFPDDPNDPYIDGEAYLRAMGEVVDEGMDVVNLSLGGRAHSEIEADLFADAIKANVVVVAAMGNDYEKGNPTSYPAAYDDVVSVGAVDRSRRRSHFSCTGPHIDLSAPGSNILSTLPMKRSAQRRETEYAAWDGTSMATPHVTAAAALVLRRHPGSSPQEVTRRLRHSAARVPKMSGKSWTQDYGTGLLNLRNALS